MNDTLIEQTNVFLSKILGMMYESDYFSHTSTFWIFVTLIRRTESVKLTISKHTARLEV